jgi:hypothetical protein
MRSGCFWVLIRLLGLLQQVGDAGSSSSWVPDQGKPVLQSVCDEYRSPCLQISLMANLSALFEVEGGLPWRKLTYLSHSRLCRLR